METERQRKSLERMTPEQRAKVEAIRASIDTPEWRAREEAVHQHYQKDRPSREELIRRGEIDPGRALPMGALAALHKALAELKALREAQGLASGEVARRSGIAPAALSRLESGRNVNPTFETLARYASAIGAELALVVRAPAPKNEQCSGAPIVEKVESIRAALTTALHELNSLQTGV